MLRSKASSKSGLVPVALNRVLQVFLAIVTIGVIYRYCWIDIADPFKCGALLSKGQWLDPGSRWSSREPFQNWQPPGCIMHEYKKRDIQECFKKRRLVFVGDSTTRQIFWAVAKKMDQKRAETEIEKMLDLDEKQQDMVFSSEGVTVQFIWDPWMNSTLLEHELRKFRADPTDTSAGGVDDSAGLILLGAPGLWHARHSKENFFKDFRDSVDAVIPYMDHASQKQALIPTTKPFTSRKQSPNFLLLAPVQVPWYQALSPSREETITPEKIDQMNDYLQQLSAHSSADVVWSYSLMTWAGYGAYEESGLHVVNNVALRKADVLLNLRCNADAASKGYPFERTCCSNYSRLSVVQWIFLTGGMLVLPTITFLRRKHVARITRLLPANFANELSVFALVICFCFYSDRTQLFEKAQKQFREKEFLSACAVVFIAGLASVRSSRHSQPGPKTPADHGFLSREQTYEWKGWMQFVILIYHYSHGSKILWIYEIVRLLVASYLFLTGFGHTLYFLEKEDYSMKRAASVLIRLNLLSCILPYMMRTEYLFYYFPPLVSFWFLVIYFTLKIGNRKNSNFGFVLVKILVSALIMTAFTMIPGILESVAFLLRYTCGISWDMTEWRFRTFLDMYIVYIGMIVGMLCHRASRLKSDSNPPRTIINVILQLTFEYPRLYKIITVTLSLIFLPGYWLLTRRSPDKKDYNWWQPYISCIPILSFVILRNSHSILRNNHLELFAWLGRFSLETYVLQYHIWLAGDTRGLLRLGIWNRWIEAAILTPIFFWTSWKMARATQTLTTWILGDGPRTSEKAVGFRDSAALLPRAKSGNRDTMAVHGAGRVSRSAFTYVAKLRSDLRWRLGTILLVMWIANVTYH